MSAPLLLLVACAEAYVVPLRVEASRYESIVRSSVACMGPATKSAVPAAKVASSRKNFWSLRSNAPKEEPVATGQKSSLPSFKISSATTPSGPSFSLPDLPERPQMPKLPALPSAITDVMSSPADPLETAEVVSRARQQIADLQPDAAPPPPVVTAAVQSDSVEAKLTLAALARASAVMTQTLLRLFFARVQLAFVRRFRKAQDRLEQAVSDVEAAPQRLLAAAKRAAYLLPYYTRAAAEIAYEDAQRLATELPTTALEQLTLTLDQARSSAAKAWNDAKAAPEQFVDSMATTVKAELTAAQDQVDDMLAQARSARSKLS